MCTFKTGIGLKTTRMVLNKFTFHSFPPPLAPQIIKRTKAKIRTFSIFKKTRDAELIPAVPSCRRMEGVGPPGAVRLQTKASIYFWD